MGGKASYPNVKGLLQVDEDGYYYYDSGKNYAVYYQRTSIPLCCMIIRA